MAPPGIASGCIQIDFRDQMLMKHVMNVNPSHEARHECESLQNFLILARTYPLVESENTNNFYIVFFQKYTFCMV